MKYLIRTTFEVPRSRSELYISSTNLNTQRINSIIYSASDVLDGLTGVNNRQIYLEVLNIMLVSYAVSFGGNHLILIECQVYYCPPPLSPVCTLRRGPSDLHSNSLLFAL
jgi:hypothetical protein